VSRREKAKIAPSPRLIKGGIFISLGDGRGNGTIKQEVSGGRPVFKRGLSSGASFYKKGVNQVTSEAWVFRKLEKKTEGEYASIHQGTEGGF